MKISILVFFILLVGCATTSTKFMTQEPVKIQNSQLNDYWDFVEDSFKLNYGINRPNQNGVVEIGYLIDSNGNVFEPKIIKSQPEGVWDTIALKALSKLRYKKAENNPTNIPVYVTMEFKFGV